jgi:hypothetical protein
MTEQDTPPEPEDTIDEVLAEESEGRTPQAAEGSAVEEVSLRDSALDVPRANALAAERRPTVLVLAGAVGSGKTSVYAAIYERLGRGAFGGWMFAGSRTIPGLEERCFLWRTESGRLTPHMEATRAGALPWLHLRLRDVERRLPAQDLLLGDYDGESFERIKDGRDDPSDLAFLRRADYVGVVIDGARIADATTRVAEQYDASLLVKALLKPKAIAKRSSLVLITTKVDEFEQFDDEPRQAANEALAAIQREASEMAELDLPMLRLAVRSYVPHFPLGHGLESLLEILLVQGPVHLLNPPAPYEAKLALGKFFS